MSRIETRAPPWEMPRMKPQHATAILGRFIFKLTSSPIEDEYDIDHVLNDIKDQMVEGESYVFDKRGRLVRQGRKKYSQEGIIKLPKISVGQPRPLSRSQVRPMTTDRNSVTSAAPRYVENKDCYRERTGHHGPRQLQKDLDLLYQEKDGANRKNYTDNDSLYVPTPPSQSSSSGYSRRRYSHVTEDSLYMPSPPTQLSDSSFSWRSHGQMIEDSLHVPTPPIQPSSSNFGRRRHDHVTDESLYAPTPPFKPSSGSVGRRHGQVNDDTMYVPTPPTKPSSSNFCRRRYSHVANDRYPAYGRTDADTVSSQPPVRHADDDIYQPFSLRQNEAYDTGAVNENTSQRFRAGTHGHGSMPHAPVPPTSKPSAYPFYSRTNRKVNQGHDEGDMWENLDDDTKEILELGNKFEISSAKIDELIKECERHCVGDGGIESVTDATADLLLEELDEMMKTPSPDHVKLESRKPMPQRPAFDNELSADIDNILKSPRHVNEVKSKFVKKDKENDGFHDDLDDLFDTPRTATRNTARKQKSLQDERDKLIKDIDDILNDPEYRPNSVAVANMNATGCTTPARMPAAANVLRMTTEPLRQWNGETAKRGVGFKSKLRKEEVKLRRPDEDIIPDRVRRKMDEYKTRKNI